MKKTFLLSCLMLAAMPVMLVSCNLIDSLPSILNRTPIFVSSYFLSVRHVQDYSFPAFLVSCTFRFLVVFAKVTNTSQTPFFSSILKSSSSPS